MLNQNDIRKEVLESLGIADLSEETQKEVLAIAAGSILQSVTAAVLSRMPEEVQKQFTDAFTGGDGETAEKLLKTHVPDADAFVQGEIRKATEEFRALYTGAK